MRFTEKQDFPTWVQALFLGLWIFIPTISGLGSQNMLVFLSMATMMALVFGSIWYLLGVMKTFVSESELTVVFGYFPVYTKRIPLSSIASAAVEDYNSLREFGGWGIRGLGKNRALNMDGHRGVRLLLNDGSRLMIGSQYPEELFAALSVDQTQKQAAEEELNFGATANPGAPPVVDSDGHVQA